MKVQLLVNLKIADGRVIPAGTIFTDENGPLPEFIIRRIRRGAAKVISQDSPSPPPAPKEPESAPEPEAAKPAPAPEPVPEPAPATVVEEEKPKEEEKPETESLGKQVKKLLGKKKKKKISK